LLNIFNLQRISGQIAALVVVSLVAIHLIVTGFFLLHHNGEPPRGESPRHQIETLAPLIAATPLRERPSLIDRLNAAFPQLAIVNEPPGSNDAPGGPLPAEVPSPPAPDHPGPPRRLLHIGPGFAVMPGYDGAHHDRVNIRLPDGTMMSARIGPDWTPSFLRGPWLITLLFIVVSITLLGLWAARALSAPLSAFARAAEDFSLGGATAPLPESGPHEIRSAAKALNRMRERITALMKDRTQMLAAISHDLRTPITRLRMRVEFIEDETHRGHMLRDLEQMRGMLESVLSFLRNDDTVEPVTLIDLAALLHLVCDQFADIGHDVSYRGPAQVTIVARPNDLLRAVTNLVENAVRFATVVVVAVDVTDQCLLIEVEDDGPGIDETRTTAVLEPFVRGDEARNMDEASGFGLGLSIARTIILAHGGALSLHNRKPHGLTARIELPRHVDTRRAA
jgi:signal transduction histidine kinase